MKISWIKDWTVSLNNIQSPLKSDYGNIVKFKIPDIHLRD